MLWEHICQKGNKVKHKLEDGSEPNITSLLAGGKNRDACSHYASVILPTSVLEGFKELTLIWYLEPKYVMPSRATVT